MIREIIAEENWPPNFRDEVNNKFRTIPERNRTIPFFVLLINNWPRFGSEW